MKRLIPYSLSALALTAPVLAHAQAKTFKQVVEIILGLLNDTAVALIALGVLMVAFGIFRFMVADEPVKRAEGRKVIIWGLVSLFIMVCVWGLVNLLLNTLFPSSNESFQLSNRLFRF